MPKILALLLAILLTGCASSTPPKPIETGAPVAPPVGYSQMKGKDILLVLPSHIANKLKYPETAPYNGDLFGKPGDLQRVKQIIDKHFIYTDDEKLHGVKEDWRAPLLMTRSGSSILGDCDDYAILAMAMLHERGLNSRLVLARIDHLNEYHLFLEYNGWLIDNRARRVRRQENSGYTLISVLEDGYWYEAAQDIRQ